MVFAALIVALSATSPSPQHAGSVPTYPATSPTPFRSPWPCPVPNYEAVIAKAVRPDVSSTDIEKAKEMGAKMSVVVRIVVGPDGKVKEATIYKSSGNMTLDYAALQAARASTYKPKVIQCKPVSGVYQFPFSFVSPSQ